MRGLARDGRSPRTSREREREREGLDSLRSLARSILFSPSPHSLLFSSLFFSLPPPSSPSFLPLHTSLPPSRASSSLSSEGSLHGGGVHEPCAPRGTATVYLNSDLRSDTGLKLAKEVSRCLCIQDTAPPWVLRTPFVPKEETMPRFAPRSTATTTRESFERGRRLKNCFHRENSSRYSPFYAYMCVCAWN